MDQQRDRPDGEARQRARDAGVRVGDAEGEAAVGVRARVRDVAQRAGGREEAQRLLDHGGGVVELVDEVRVLADLLADGGGVGVLAEDEIELGQHLRVAVRVLVQEVEDVGDRAGGCVVAGEDEGLDAVDAVLAEGRVHHAGRGAAGGGGGGGGGLGIGFQGEIDDGAFPVLSRDLLRGAVGRGLRGREFPIQLLADEAVELAAVEEEVQVPQRVEPREGVDRRRRHQGDLAPECVDDCVLGALGVEVAVQHDFADDVDGQTGGEFFHFHQFTGFGGFPEDVAEDETLVDDIRDQRH